MTLGNLILPADYHSSAGGCRGIHAARAAALEPRPKPLQIARLTRIARALADGFSHGWPPNITPADRALLERIVEAGRSRGISLRDIGRAVLRGRLAELPEVFCR